MKYTRTVLLIVALAVGVCLVLTRGCPPPPPPPPPQDCACDNECTCDAACNCSETTPCVAEDCQCTHKHDVGKGPVNIPSPNPTGPGFENFETVRDQHYVQGRHIKSSSMLRIQGTGKDIDWGISGQANFLYISRVNLDTVVTKNNENEIIFEFDFGVVDKTSVITNYEFQLEWPDDPLLDWAVGAMIAQNPVLYAKYKVISILVDALDPNLRKTLTKLGDLFKVKPSAADELGIQSEVQRLNGSRFRINYNKESERFSIVETSAPKKFNRRELTNLGNQLTLFQGYYIMPIDHDINDEWNVDLVDVVSLFAFGYDTDLSGDVDLKRNRDVVLKGTNGHPDENVRLLSAVKGQMYIGETNGSNDFEGSLDVLEGQIWFSAKNLLARKGLFEFKVNAMKSSNDHIIFNAVELRVFTVKTRFDSRFLTQ